MDNLDQIAAEASALENEQQAAQDAINNPEPAIDPAETWAQIPKMMGGLLAIGMPELSKVYTDSACLNWGRAMCAVAEKYEWDAAETMSRFAPEIALVVSSIPLVVPTIAAIKMRKAAREITGAEVPEKVQETLPQGGNLDEPK